MSTFLTLRHAFLPTVMALLAGSVRANTPHDATLASWQADRFGMFIHWGPVSLQGTEIGWSRAGERRGYNRPPGTQVPVEIYDNLYKKFNPTEFNAREWVALAQAAGMKYLVFTTRHHDGFSMFDTQASDYKITSPLSPFRRDVVKELADACHAAGLRFGVYYSQPDFHNADAFTPGGHAKYQAYLKAQLRELLTNYGQIDILWFDGLGRSARDFDSEAMNRLARELQPQIIINNRNGGMLEDFDTPEQRVGKYQDDRPWESCITIGRQWSWKPNDEIKSLKDCLRTLVLAAGGDGNLLFNVGPMPDGRIEPRQADRLSEIGQWLKTHGEAIYGTRGGPWKPTKAIASTRRGNTVYIHLLRDEPGPVTLPALSRPIRSAALLDTGAPVTFAQTGGTLTLTLPAGARDPIDAIVKLELTGNAMDLPAIAQADEIIASSSNPPKKYDPRNDPAFAFDNEPRTKWSPENPAAPSWIAADLIHPRSINRVRIDENSGTVKHFELQYRDGSGWHTILTGTTIGKWYQQSFPAVTAREFRLVLPPSLETPVINDIEFFDQ